MMTFRRVFRSLVRRPRYSFGFLLAGVLGLTSNLYLDSLENSIRSSLNAKSRELLTGDLSISMRRLATDADRKSVQDFLAPLALEQTRSLDLYSMLATAGGSRMIQLVAIEENYPLYGKITLERGGVVAKSTAKTSLANAGVWIDTDVRDTLGLKIGDLIKLGERNFTVGDVILDDTSNTWRGFTLAPRVMLKNDELWKTGLIRKGSTLWDRTYSILKPEFQAKNVAKEWNAKSEDPAVRAVPHEEASEQVAKLSSRLNDYLSLVGLTTLFLALVGISFLFQTELRRRLRMIGTMRALGDSTRRMSLEISLEAAVLGLTSALIAIALVQFTLPIASRIVAGIAGVSVVPQISWLSASVTLLLGALVGYFLALPFATRVSRMKPGALFQDEANLELPWRRKDVFLFLPVVGIFFALSIFHAHSWRLGSLFFGLTSLAVLGLYGMGRFLFSRIERIQIRNLTLRLAVRSLSRNPWSSISGFIALGIGTLLLSLIPSLQSVVESEIEKPEGSKVPSLFLFDIQEDQISDLAKIVENSGAKLDYVSPMIRARLETLKGKPVEKALDFAQRSTREQEEEERSRNRGFNLSYRATLSDSESISEGRNVLPRFDSAKNELPEVTLETKFADRLGVGVGDKIGFDVQGVSLEAKVVGLRKVRWTSFQPNFFVIFQPGILDDAPKTLLAAIPALTSEARKQLQGSIVSAHPNISVIQVDDMVRKMLQLFEQMGIAIQITALVSLLAGVFVFFTIARRQTELRRRSALLLKTVGASSGDILAIFLWEFGILSFSAAVLGTAFSYGISKLISWIVFDRLDAGMTWLGLLAVLSVVTTALVAVVIASYSLVREKPWRLLQAEGER